MSTYRREVERKFWSVLQAAGRVPDCTTSEGKAEYMRLKRDVEKQVATKNLSVFLFHFDVCFDDVKKVLAKPMWGEDAFRFRPKKKQR